MRVKTEEFVTDTINAQGSAFYPGDKRKPVGEVNYAMIRAAFARPRGRVCKCGLPSNSFPTRKEFDSHANVCSEAQ